MNLLTTFVIALAAQAIEEDAFEATFRAILPKAEEELWRRIPWRPVLWDAVLEANAQDKPVLFWGMNGHPMACT